MCAAAQVFGFDLPHRDHVARGISGRRCKSVWPRAGGRKTWHIGADIIRRTHGQNGKAHVESAAIKIPLRTPVLGYGVFLSRMPSPTDDIARNNNDNHEGGTGRRNGRAVDSDAAYSRRRQDLH